MLKKTLRQRIGAVVMTLVMAVAAPFSGLSAISAEAPATIEPDYANLDYDYTITGWNVDNCVRDADGFVADGHTYCLDRKEIAPSGQKAARVLLSEVEGYSKRTDYPKVFTNDVKLRLMALLRYGNEGFTDPDTGNAVESVKDFVKKIEINEDQMAEITKKAGEDFDKDKFLQNWNRNLINDSRLMQDLIWVFVHDENEWQRFVTDSREDDNAAGRPYTGHEDLYRYVEENSYAYRSDDPLNDPYSLWNMYYKKIADYIDANMTKQAAKDFEDGWDAYVYINMNNSAGRSHQNMIGVPFNKNDLGKSIKIAKVDPGASGKGVNVYGATLLLESKTDGVTFDNVNVKNVNGLSVSDDKKSVSFITMSDEAVFEGINPGDYTLTETEAPRNYIKNNDPVDFTVRKDPETQHIYIEMNGERVITDRVIFENRRGRIKLRKYVKGTQVRVSDAMYALYYGVNVDENNNVINDASPISTKRTLSNDDTVFENIILGTEYVIMEDKAPDGYFKSSDAIRFTITDDGSNYGKIDYKITGDDMSLDISEDFVLNCYEETSRVKISKKDIATGEEVPGARIRISGKAYDEGKYIKNARVAIDGTLADSAYISRGLTNEDGGSFISFRSGSSPAELLNIPAGEYKLYEESAPEGYVLETTEISFTVDEQGNVKTKDGAAVADKTFTITNKKTEMTVSKREIGGSDELPGATLTIYREADLRSDGTLRPGRESVMEWVSESTPKTVTGLRTGVNYVLREKVAPAGYGKITSDIKFRFDTDGTLTVNDTETADNAILVEDAPFTVTISKRDITGGDEELPGAVLTIKADTDGVTLENVTAKAGSTDVALTRNDSNTEISFVSGSEAAVLKRIPAGEYTLTETSAPDGYTVASDTRFTVGKDGTVTVDGKANDKNSIVINDKVTEIGISKVDIADSKELAGAVLAVYVKSDLDTNGDSAVAVDSWISGSDGTDNDQKLLPHTIKGLNVDTEYVLREKTAPEGYMLTTDIVFTISKTGVVTANGAPVTDDGVILVEDKKISVKISKVDIADSKELAGAELAVYEKSDLDTNGDSAVAVDSWISGSDGTDNDQKLLPHAISGLDINKEYVLREKTAPEGYMLTTDIVFTIDEAGVVTANGAPVTADGVILVEDTKGSVKVSKVDTANGEELEGAELKVLDKDGGIVDEWVSGREVHEIKGIRTNTEYILRETVAPAGYGRIASDITFTVAPDGTVASSAPVTEDGVILVEDTINTISIKKTDLVDGKEVPGAALTVKADTEGVTLEGVTAKTGDTVTALKLSDDKTGISFVSGDTETVLYGLPEGKYTLTENAAPDGYELCTSEISFEVKSDGTTNGSVITLSDAPSSIKINKNDLTGEKEVKNAVLTVYSDDLTAEQWEKIAENNPAVKLTEEKNGVTWISGSGVVELTGLPNGRYHLRESQGENIITDNAGNIYSVYASDIVFTVDNTKTPAVTVETATRDRFNSSMEKEYAVYDGDVLTICDAVRVVFAKATEGSREGGGSGGSSSGGGSNGGGDTASPSDGGSEGGSSDSAPSDGGSEGGGNGDSASSDGGSEGGSSDSAPSDGGSEGGGSGDSASSDGGSEGGNGDSASSDGGSEGGSGDSASSDGGSEGGNSGEAASSEGEASSAAESKSDEGGTTDENVPTGNAEIPSIAILALAALTVVIRKKSRD